MGVFVWLGFVLSILTILILSRWHLGFSLIAASVVLAYFTMAPDDFWGVGVETLENVGILLLALAVALIPMIGGIMEASGQMRSLVSNLRIRRCAFLGISPALVGLLPMPGGALLSAPLVKGGGKGVSNESKVALNVWFRHILYLVYPLSTALIVSTYLAGISVYDIIPYLFPFFAFTILLGYVFFLREASGKITGERPFSWRGLLLPLSVLMAAPIIDFILLQGLKPEIRELALIIGVLVSFFLSIYFSRLPVRALGWVTWKMRPWNFGLIILGMFLFLGVFMNSGVPEGIGFLNLSSVMLCVGLGFMLGLVTGRIQVPASIIIPIYLGTAGAASMLPWHFALCYISIFMGYVISPVHPCISVSLEYFKVSLRDFLMKILPPAIIVMIITLILALIIF
jgi:integral membrane protein (TIGR00529 family)